MTNVPCYDYILILNDEKKMIKTPEIIIETIHANHEFSNEHAFIGVSPFNSYFIEDNMLTLFNWAMNHFKKVSIFIPDEISAHTLLALGYPLKRAIYKTRRQDTYLKNKIIRTLSKLNVEPNAIEEMIVPLGSLKKNERYLSCYQQCLNQFENNDSFRMGCVSTSEWILSAYLQTDNISESAKYEAVKYFLAELPLFINTPEILQLNASSFIYHSIPTFLKQLFMKNKYIAPNQYFVIAKIENAMTTFSETAA